MIFPSQNNHTSSSVWRGNEITLNFHAKSVVASLKFFHDDRLDISSVCIKGTVINIMLLRYKIYSYHVLVLFLTKLYFAALYWSNRVKSSNVESVQLVFWQAVDSDLIGCWCYRLQALICSSSNLQRVVDRRVHLTVIQRLLKNDNHVANETQGMQYSNSHDNILGTMSCALVIAELKS